MSKQAVFRRQFRAIKAHFARYPNKPAPTTRTLEFAFETSKDHSDAMSACLMKTKAIRAGLEQWNVFDSQIWKDSLARHENKTISEIIKEVYPE